MQNPYRFLILFILLSNISTNVFAQNDTTYVNPVELKHSISIDPLLPLFNSFATIYEYEKTDRSSLILGVWYSKSTETYPKMLAYPGYVFNISPIVGYRYYFWKNLHAEYQLYPGYCKYYEKNEDRFYSSFNLFNEFRIGYKFKIQVLKIPLNLNFQFPVGFTIFDINAPESFKVIRKQDPIFYIFYPNIYIGFRF